MNHPDDDFERRAGIANLLFVTIAIFFSTLAAVSALYILSV